jgi:aryl-alcohol dehydrogenase-like predicted oxidoreductase
MKTRKLGENGPSVSAVGLGCMGMSFAYGVTPADEAESVATLHRALDLGVTFFDTAEMYGPFENEKLLGRTLKGRREGLVIATKFGFDISGPGPVKPGALNSRPDHIREVCDASLMRLGIDCIDLFYQHRVDPNVPIEDVAGALADLVKAGKIRHLGLSEAGAQTIRRANAVHPISALQSEYSLFSRDIETEILPTCRALGIGLVPYSPLGRGILTGAVRRRDDLSASDFRRRLPRFADGAIDSNLAVVDALGALATEKGCTTAQLALAWVLAQGPDVAPIPGARRRRNLEDNCGAVDVVLTAEDLARIEVIAPKGVAVGDRYEPERMARLNA